VKLVTLERVTEIATPNMHLKTAQRSFFSAWDQLPVVFLDAAKKQLSPSDLNYKSGNGWMMWPSQATIVDLTTLRQPQQPLANSVVQRLLNRLEVTPSFLR